MKSIVGIALIVLALFLGYDGLNKFQNSAASVKILGVEISAEDKGSRQTAILELGLGVVALMSGIFMLKSGKQS